MTKRLNMRAAIAIVASLLLAGGVACSEDDVQNQGENQVDENTDTEDAGGDADPSGDAVASGDNGDDGDAGSNDGNGNDGNDGNGTNYDDNQFDVDPVECAYPPQSDDCEGGEFGPATFLSQFEIADDPDDPCCFDLEGGSTDEEDYDNFIGEDVIPAIEGSLTGFDDVNANIASSIQAGYLSYLLEAYRWEHPKWDDGLKLNVYRGGEVDDINDALAGDGSFEIDPDNLDDDGDPKYGFERVIVADGEMQASDGRVEITLPSLVEDLGVTLADVRMRGDVVQSPEPDLTAGGSFSIENGEMGGVLLRDEFYKSLNEAAFECDCFEFDFDDPDNPDPWSEGVFGYSEENDNWQCSIKSIAPESCQDSNVPRCRTLGDEQLCNILGPFSNADVADMKVDGEHGYSIGMRFDSVTTEIRGVDN